MKKPVILVLLLLTGCVHNKIADQNSNQPISVRFQNMVGLNLGHGDCGIINFGGLDRLCEYSATRPVDLFFQIGPAFVPVEFGKDISDIREAQAERKVQWKEWERQGARFYSVSGRDLSPSLALFEEITKGSSIERLSTNLRSPNNEFLFKPFVIVDIRGRKLAFLGFADPNESIGKASWVVSDPVTAFQEVVSQIPPEITVYHALGSLSAATRLKIAAVAKKPVIFLGGELTESNTTEIQLVGPNHYWAKAPDLGRGVTEMEIAPAEPNAKGLVIGDSVYRWRALALRKMKTMSPSCAALNPENDGPGFCAISEMGKGCDAPPTK